MTLWYKKTSEEIIDLLKTDSENGLSHSEAQERSEKYGLNTIEEVDSVKWPKLVLQQFANIMVVILIVAMAISFAVGEHLDGFAILIIILINAVVGFIQEYKAEKAIDALKKLTAPDAIVIREGKTLHIPSVNLVPGDVIVLEEGKYIPADARLIEEAEMQVNESSLTGESKPVAKILEALTGDKVVGDRKNMVYLGTVVTRGHGKAIVVHTGMQTEFGSIAHMVQTEKPDSTPLQKQLTNLSKWLAYITLGVIALLFLKLCSN